jgi:hypothetical protein
MSESLSMIDYVAVYHKEVQAEYIAYLNRDILPKVGDKVITLRGGFGGGAGVIRKVSEVTETQIFLMGNPSYPDSRYSCDISKWYLDIKILK